MSERDAFGREKGEDSLAEMGWSWSTDARRDARRRPRRRTPPTPVTPEPTFTAAPTPPPAMSAGAGPAWTPGPPAMVRLHRRRRRRGHHRPARPDRDRRARRSAGRPPRCRRGSGALDDFQSAVRDATANAVPTARGAADRGRERVAAAPGGAEGRARQAPVAADPSLRVAPERIDAQVLRRREDARRPGPRGRHGLGRRDPGRRPRQPLKVDPAAPNRIVRTAAKRAGRSPDACTTSC